MARGGRAGDRYESARVARDAPPTLAVPGSPERIEVLRRRYEKRQSLVCPGDLIDSEQLRLNFVRRGKFLVKDDADPVVDERTPAEKIAQKTLRKVEGTTPGDRIRQARLARGWSQVRLARAAGVSHDLVSLTESRHRHPGLATLYLLSHALGVCPDWLACLPAHAG